ncbi:methanol O-anthraniloyltransferase [Ricinus communis]|uniref:Taxadien-5-alpha-ol O-acetyltransferase, putative n=1 Tax=Ricinus communis TaxID=3988 RepID=B9RUQ5_RICCO|nr:methanol O-anthraniloyltransferase [Ricinus communis]EEF45042.1 Taxadien-5-alpha-ol O-acetyltransferase, putative [Ricinus communis]|eukprot:XP_002517500.1 methanol O-anthraniloyltransferase [Ricinus communis]
MALPPPPFTFAVRRSPPELIVPARPTPRELKKVSDIDDQEGLRFQISFVMFYRSLPSMKGRDPVEIIRKALSEALVFYYPFAGRLIEGPNRKLIVDCNGEGILFIEADADITIEQLGDSMQPPCPCIEELLYDVPGSSGIIGCPLLLIQITRLACGGFVFAVRLNHVMSDSVGLAKFFKATGEIAKGACMPSLFPVWQREILSARNPPQVTHKLEEYEEIKHTDDKSILTLDSPDMVQRAFFFGPKEMRSLRRQLPSHLRNCSSFEMLAACLWRCRTIAFDIPPNEVVRLSCIMNVRGKKGLQLPDGYCGNSFIFPAVLSRAEHLCKNPLGYAVELVRKSKSKMSEEYIRSTIDLMEIKGRPHYVTAWNLLLVDMSHVGLADVDFGWGNPVYFGPTGSFPNISMFSRFKNSKGENGFVVPMWLPRTVMEKFQDEFLKMTEESAENLNDARRQRIISTL